MNAPDSTITIYALLFLFSVLLITISILYTELRKYKKMLDTEINEHKTTWAHLQRLITEKNNQAK